MSRLIAPTGHTLDLPARHVTFGEAPECDIPLTGGYGLAGLHFEIAPGTDGISYLRDASGQAGTLVNGRPVTVTALREGDVIQAGQLTLRFAETPAISSVGGPPPLAAPVARTPVILPSGGEIVTAADAGPTPPTGGQPPVADPTAVNAARPAVLAMKGSSRSNFAPSSFVVRIASGALLLVAAAAFCATDPGQRLISPLVTKIHQWNTARAPKPVASTPKPSDSPSAAAVPAGPAPTVIAQTSHQEISRLLLTERTQTLIYADLRQLVPCYNLMASQQGLPSQREMSDAFRKAYGAVIDPFEHLSLLQSDAKDEFLVILSGKNALNLEKIIGQPARPATDTRPASRIYSIKAGTRSLSAALYDPFTLLLGSPRAITRATQAESGPQLREARCMFPETAHHAPGAMIMVKRVNQPEANAKAAAATAFETIVTNLFLESTTPSTLTLTRNPEVPEPAFVDAAAPALKEQAAALAPSLGAGATPLADLRPADLNITRDEASVALPGGPSLISAALETMARSFVRTAPSMGNILQAQDAVMRFNTARATGAETALKASSSREALELLNEGIRGGGRFGGATFQFRSKNDELENLSSLLAMDETVGLVYRPDSELLTGASFDLALKARNYRNAELLLTLWQQAKLKTSEEETPASAAGRVLTWATTAEGRSQRNVLGLPSLTAEELAGALAHLSITDRLLTWKPGEANYRSWVRLVHPDPHRDATRLAATFNAAASSGAIPASATRDLRAAIILITRGVTGRGKHAGKTYQLDTFTPAELTAATALLALEDGSMKVTATSAH